MWSGFPPAVVAQVWREGRRQAGLACLLRGVEEVEHSGKMLIITQVG